LHSLLFGARRIEESERERGEKMMVRGEKRRGQGRARGKQTRKDNLRKREKGIVWLR